MMVPIKQNEVLLHDREQWLHFHNPHKRIVCESLDEVIPALSEIERLVENNGWYAAGFLSYESASAFDPALPSKPIAGFPYLWFGLFSQPDSISFPEIQTLREPSTWKPTIQHEDYNDAIAKIKAYIAQGKTY
ncbi:MAG TPA: hypothetical protein VK909_02800, partial [Anaerolineales bacterium]|nr:hypothetical protein [Anaerolineales bacterium]